MGTAMVGAGDPRLDEAAQWHAYGEDLRRRGRTAEANAALRQAFALLDTCGALRSRLGGQVYNSLGLLAADDGSLEAARTAFETALEIAAAAPGRRDRVWAITADNLADTLARLGDLPAARRRIAEAQAVFRSDPESPPADLVRSLLIEADLEALAGDAARASAALRKVIACAPEADTAAEAVIAAGRLAEACASAGDEAGARAALATGETYAADLDPDHPAVDGYGMAWARTVEALGDPAAAAAAWADLLRRRWDFAADEAPFWTPEDSLVFVETLAAPTRELLRMAARPAAPAGLAEPALVALLNTKDVAAEALRRRRIFCRTGGRDLRRAFDAERRFARLAHERAFEGPGLQDQEEFGRWVDEDLQSRGLAAGAVGHALRARGDQVLPPLRPLSDVRAALPAGVLLLAFAEIQDGDPDAAPSALLGFALTRRRIRAERLGEARSTLAALRALRDLAATRPRPDPGDARAAALGTLAQQGWSGLLAPFAREIDAAARILILAGGRLAEAPFQLLGPAAAPPLCARLEVAQLRTLGDLFRRAEPRPAGDRRPRVLGDPDFEAGRILAPVDGARPADVLRFERLGHARTEVRRVAKLLSARPITGAQAGKSRLLDAAAPSVLHVATHGVYFEDYAELPRQDEHEDAAYPRGATIISHEELGGPDRLFRTLSGRHISRRKWLVRHRAPQAMLRAGLAFAGANAWLDEDLREGVGNGIATAAELAYADLCGAELATLSACETGRGQAPPLEGPYGLRRALLVAGARRTVASLWRIDDGATTALMGGFYSALAAGQRCGQALRTAQARVRATAGWEDPYFWGAFVCEGDPEGRLAPPS